MNREPGYYWVKYKDIWQPGRYFFVTMDEYIWAIIGENYWKQDYEFQEIDETPIKREPKSITPNLYEHTNWTF